jgi:hypothetical protein
MLTWVLTGRGTKALAAAYFAMAALALLVATTTWVVVAAHHAAGTDQIQLNITQRS